MWRKLAFSLVLVCVAAQLARGQVREEPTEPAAAPSSSSAPSSASAESYWSTAGYGTLAVVANIFYMPAKVVYAVVGLPIGGLAYVLTVGDDVTAQKIWSPSLGGTYVITPAMLRSEEPILFSGPSYSSDRP